MSEWILTSSVLIVIVVLLRRALRGRISLRLRYALWALVLLRLLVPVNLLDSPLSVMNAVERREELPVTAPVSAPADSSGTGESAAADPGAEMAGTVSILPGADAPAPVPEEPVSRTSRLPGLLTAVWCVGMAAAAVVLLAVNLSFSARLRRSRVPFPAENCPLPVYRCPLVPTPCLFGLFRSSVYITDEAAGDARTLAHVLAHESTHYAHRDNWWALLRSVCLVLHWYNPLVWLAAELSRRDAELACDEGTIRLLGEENRADYGRTLIGLTVTRAGAGDLLRCATTMVGGGKSIRERIRLIAQKPRTAAWTLAVLVLAAALAVGCTFTGAEKTETEPDTVTDNAPEPVPDTLELSDPLSSASPAIITGEGAARLFAQYCGFTRLEELDGPGEMEMLSLRFRDSATGESTGCFLYRDGTAAFEDTETGTMRRFRLAEGEAMYGLFHNAYALCGGSRTGENVPQSVAVDAGFLLFEIFHQADGGYRDHRPVSLSYGGSCQTQAAEYRVYRLEYEFCMETSGDLAPADSWVRPEGVWLVYGSDGQYRCMLRTGSEPGDADFAETLWTILSNNFAPDVIYGALDEAWFGEICVESVEAGDGSLEAARAFARAKGRAFVQGASAGNPLRCTDYALLALDDSFAAEGPDWVAFRVTLALEPVDPLQFPVGICGRFSVVSRELYPEEEFRPYDGWFAVTMDVLMRRGGGDTWLTAECGGIRFGTQK